jgi:peptidyl-prolyl cis-trans isomerase A (cyclophilin A)
MFRARDADLFALLITAVLTIGAISCQSGEDSESNTPHPALFDASLATETAPDKFRVQIETTKGDVLVEVTRAWSPFGADRFYNLVRIGFFNDISFHRVLDNFVAQFGVHGEPRVFRTWKNQTFPDDPRVESNLRGTLAFAKPGDPNSRTTQLFFNLMDNTVLDEKKFIPIGKVVSGMEALDQIYVTDQGGRDGARPSQSRIEILGGDRLKTDFPDLDYVVRMKILD